MYIDRTKLHFTATNFSQNISVITSPDEPSPIALLDGNRNSLMKTSARHPRVCCGNAVQIASIRAAYPSAAARRVCSIYDKF